MDLWGFRITRSNHVATAWLRGIRFEHDSKTLPWERRPFEEPLQSRSAWKTKVVVEGGKRVHL